MKLDIDIFSLIVHNKNEEVKSIIENFNLYNVVDWCERTILHYVAIGGNVELTDYLLSKGYYVDIQDGSGNTPLMEALIYKHHEVAISLLKVGADPLIINKRNKSSLNFVFAQQEPNDVILNMCFTRLMKGRPYSSEKAAKSLIDVGCKFYQSFYLRDAEIVEHMIRQGCRVNSVDLNNLESGYTNLHISIVLSDPKIVKVLLKHGANPDNTDAQDRTPLFYLFSSGRDATRDTEILEALLDADADLMLIDSQGLFECTSLLTNGPQEAIRLLLGSSNVDFNFPDISGSTMLHYLAWNRNPGIAEELKFHLDKFDVNAIDKVGRSPLHFAAFRANVPMIKFCLELQHIRNDSRGAASMLSALCLAYKNSHMTELEYQISQCVELLLQRNIDFKFVVNKHGQQISVFDIDMSENDRVKKLKPVIAHIALQQKLGKGIAEVVTSKIESQLSMKEYFDQCQRILDLKIAGNVTLFKLLTANEKKMAKYLNNGELVENEIYLGQNQNFASSFPYYNNTLILRFSKGAEYKALKKKVAPVIFECSNGQLAENSIIAERLIDFYLNKTDLQQLCQF